MRLRAAHRFFCASEMRRFASALMCRRFLRTPLPARLPALLLLERICRARCKRSISASISAKTLGLFMDVPWTVKNEKRLAVAISTIVLVSEFGIIGCYRLSAAVLGMFGIRKFFVIFAVSAAVGGRLHLCTLSPRANMKLHD